MPMRISRTARWMRSLSTLRSPASDNPLTPHQIRQLAQVADDERGLGSKDVAPAVHEYRVYSHCCSPAYVRDRIVADVDHPVPLYAAGLERLLEDSRVRFLDPGDRGDDEAVEVAHPVEILQHPGQPEVPVRDYVHPHPHLPEPAQHSLGLGVGIVGDPTIRDCSKEVRRSPNAPGACGDLGVTALEAGEVLLRAVLDVLLYMPPQTLPHRPLRPLDGKRSVRRVGRQVLYVTLNVEMYPQKRTVHVEKDRVVAHLELPTGHSTSASKPYSSASR